MANSTGVLSDMEAMGMKADMTHEEIVHLTELSPEEKILEKKLLRRIDILIMPLVVLVYLLNYIDRYALPLTVSRCCNNQHQTGRHMRLMMMILQK